MKLKIFNEETTPVVEPDPKGGFTVRNRDADPKVAYAYMVISKGLCREIVTACALEEVTQRFIVSTTPVDKNLYPIITKSAKPTTRTKEKV